MLYIFLILQTVLVIFLYYKLSNKIELEAIKQNNGVLLEIKSKIEKQDWIFEQLFRELKLSMFDTRTVDELSAEKEYKERLVSGLAVEGE